MDPFGPQIAELIPETVSSTHAELGVFYSDFFRNQLGNMPDSNNNNLSLLDKHDQELKDIQKLKHLLLTISNNTEGQGDSEPPTTTQTLTFINNMKNGMSVRYKKSKQP